MPLNYKFLWTLNYVMRYLIIVESDPTLLRPPYQNVLKGQPIYFTINRNFRKLFNYFFDESSFELPYNPTEKEEEQYDQMMDLLDNMYNMLMNVLKQHLLQLNGIDETNLLSIIDTIFKLASNDYIDVITHMIQYF